MLSLLLNYEKADLHYRIRDWDILLLQEGLASWKNRHSLGIGRGAPSRICLA